MGPWNMLSCRPNSTLTLSLAEQNANGTVVGFDIYPYSSGATNTQTIFAFRDSASLNVYFTFELYTNGTLGGSSYSAGSWVNNFKTSTAVNWSKLIIYKMLVISFKLFRRLE